MKITSKQLRRIIKEELSLLSETDSDGDGSLDAGELRRLADELEGKDQQPLKSFRVPYSGFGYGGRRIISRDKAHLEFVPKGSGPLTREDMFRSVTLLNQGDPEIQKALGNSRNVWYVPKDMASIDQYDVYSVHSTTTG